MLPIASASHQPPHRRDVRTFEFTRRLPVPAAGARDAAQSPTAGPEPRLFPMSLRGRATPPFVVPPCLDTCPAFDRPRAPRPVSSGFALVTPPAAVDVAYSGPAAPPPPRPPTATCGLAEHGGSVATFAFRTFLPAPDRLRVVGFGPA